MGDPKKQHKAYTSPLKRWDKEKIELERALVKTYGLRRKKELWGLEALLRRIRSRAKNLIAKKDANEEKIILQKLHKLGVIRANATLDDVLSLQIQQILERRLQTIIHKSNFANTPKQARQFIVHGHVEVDGIKVTAPSYWVSLEEQSKISFKPKSSLNVTFKKIEKKTKEQIAAEKVEAERKTKLEEIALDAEEAVGLGEKVEEIKKT